MAWIWHDHFPIKKEIAFSFPTKFEGKKTRQLIAFDWWFAEKAIEKQGKTTKEISFSMQKWLLQFLYGWEKKGVPSAVYFPYFSSTATT